MNQPMKVVLHRLDTLGRIEKLVLELSKFNVSFKLRPLIKAEDFVLECIILEEGWV